MSKLESLLQELCPDGVEYKKLSDVCLRQKGMAITAGQMKELNKENGEIKIFAAGNTTANVNYGDIPDKAIITKESIIVKSRGNIGFEYYTKPFTHKNELWSYARKTANINLKFIFYYLENNIEYFQAKAKTGKLPQISTPDTDNFSVPVPPLPVQEEIVRILDHFTELQKTIRAELELRKKQFIYHREKLLDFSSKTVLKVPLGEIALVTKLAGFEFTKYVKYSNQGEIIALRGLNVKNGRLELNDVKYIDESDFSKLTRSKLMINDMLFTYVGTIGEVALIEQNDKFYLAPNVALIRCKDERILPKFLRYYFQSDLFFKTQINRLLQASSMKNIPMEKIRKFEIPLPSIEKQKHIISILDSFDTLCYNDKIGLPAEIAARQTQYEYYRDKLLTFKARA